MHGAVAADEPALLGDKLAGSAVPVRQRLLDLVGDAGAEHGKVALGKTLSFAGEEIAVRPPRRLLLGDAGELGPGLVDELEGQVLPLDVGGDGKLVEHVAVELGLAHAPAQRLLALLHLRDVDTHADEGAVVGTRVDDLEPAAVRIAAFIDAVAKPVPLHSRPRSRRPDRFRRECRSPDRRWSGNSRACGRARWRRGREARLPDRLQPGQRIPKLLVGKHEFVVAVVDDDAGRQRFQHVGQLPPRHLGFRLAALHLGHVEDEAGDVAPAAAQIHAMLAHDTRALGGALLELLLDLVGLAARQHLAFRRLEFGDLVGRQEMSTVPAEHRLRRLAEHRGEGLVDEDEVEVLVLDEDRVPDGVQHRLGEPRPLQRRLERRDQPGDVAPDAAIAEERAFRAETRSTSDRYPAAIRPAGGEFIDEVAKGPPRLEVVEMRLRLLRPFWPLLQEIEAEASEHIFGRDAGRLLIVLRKPGEAQIGIGLPDPVGTRLRQVEDLGASEFARRA